MIIPVIVVICSSTALSTMAFMTMVITVTVFLHHHLLGCSSKRLVLLRFLKLGSRRIGVVRAGCSGFPVRSSSGFRVRARV